MLLSGFLIPTITYLINYNEAIPEVSNRMYTFNMSMLFVSILANIILVYEIIKKNRSVKSTKEELIREMEDFEKSQESREY
jgi:hypothetical protein